MLLTTAAAFTVVLLGLTFAVRRKDLPQAAGVTPWQHLEERKAAIYENLRDLQFEYRVGKLSDSDYQQTKLTLQKELAGVLAEIEETAKRLGVTTRRSAPAAKQPVAKPAIQPDSPTCPNCGAKFSGPMK